MRTLCRHTEEVRAIGRVGVRGAARLAALVALLALVTLGAQSAATALAADGLPPGVPVPSWAKGRRVHFDPAEPQNPRLAGADRVASSAETAVSDGEASPDALSADSMHYYGGPVENEPRLVLVFWGSGWSSSPGLEHELEAAAEGLPGSGFQKLLTQYSSLDGPISPDLLDSPVVEKYYDPREITTEVTGEAAAQEGYEVAQRTGGGADGNATYAVLPAPGTAPLEGKTCGFHQTSGSGWATGPSVAVILDTEGAPGCGPPTMTLTHEYAESVTDPDGGSGWTRADSGDTEIADVCNALGPARMADGALVAQLWDDSKGACEVEDDDPGSVPIGPYAEPSIEDPSPYGSTNLTIESEKLETSIYPCDLEAHYYFEYGPTDAYGYRTAESVVAAAWGAIAVSTTISGLEHNTPYHWRVVVRTSNGTFDGVDHEFSIPYDPEIREEGSSDVQSTQASVGGWVQPGGIATTYYIEYGPTEGYGAKTEEASAGSGEVFEGVSAELNDLEPGTVYHFRVVATNAHGTTFGEDSEFETHGGKPAATSLPATNIGYTRATLTGSVYGKYITTDYYFEYGTTSDYGQRTTEREARGEERPEINAQEVDGLAPDALYHYRIVATNRFYGTTYGVDQTFSTYSEPTVETEAPTGVAYDAATLRGTINPGGMEISYYFEYGPTEAYGRHTSESSAGSGSASVEETQSVSGLEEDTTYHYRMVATNGYGTTYGADQVFSTGTKSPVQVETPTTVGTTTLTVVPGPTSIANEILTPPGPGPSPVVTNARQSAARWREDNRLARISRARAPKAPTGTTFSFSLNEQANVSFSFTQLQGRYDGNSCLASQHRARARKSCNQQAAKGSLSFTGHMGTNSVVFAGRISSRDKLNPGTYELIITATNAVDQRSAPVRLRFTMMQA
ncbi:MAG TPA: fibronectin type III domain-containing protein [Solirubrobacteraceae bacterium]|nr:fibronectin type III domain-containing protein [Solirubrobacteraceae bacterium]